MPITRNLAQRHNGWLRMAELPFSRRLADDLIRRGFLFSVEIGTEGSRRGVRLVETASLDRYLKEEGERQRQEQRY